MASCCSCSNTSTLQFLDVEFAVVIDFGVLDSPPTTAKETVAGAGSLPASACTQCYCVIGQRNYPNWTRISANLEYCRNQRRGRPTEEECK